MRNSRAITLTLLSGLTLTGCCLSSLGCGRGGHTTAEQHEPPDYTWYDADGNPIPEKWKTDERGNRVLDPEGRPIPEPGVPYDRYRRPWVRSGLGWVPLPIIIGRTTHYSSSSSRSGSWLTGGSGYRSPSTTTYRAPTGSGSAPVGPGYHPPSATTYRAPTGSGSASVGPGYHPPSTTTSSSISRGGFGSTGSSSSSSGSS